MEVTFELTVDSTGEPKIKFRHHDKKDNLIQKTLGRFIDLAQERGIKIKHTSGYIDTAGNSHGNYEIVIKDN